MRSRPLALAVALALLPAAGALAGPLAIDLSTYTQVGRYTLPAPSNTTPPAGSLLAEEVSAVTFNRDTNSLFVVGDGGTSIVQVSKTGALINSMTLALNPARPQGAEFYDPEGLAYIGNGRFVMVEERDRRAVLFTYNAGTTLGRADTQSVKLGTTIGNVGLEGLTFDPLTGGYIFAKEENPKGIFQTTLDFAAGTASNGSATTVNSTNLFDPALLTQLPDFAEVFALSNVQSLTGQPDGSNLLVLSQVSGRVQEVSRSGQVLSTLTFTQAPTDTLSVADQQFEGLTMDDEGILYATTENGLDPQLFVFAPAAVAVPEPASTAMLLAALGMMMGWRARR